MSAPGRTPQQVLDELGEQLDAAFHVQAGRRRRARVVGGRRLIAAIVGVAVVGGSTAAATRTIFLPAPPLPRLAPLAADLADGTTSTIRWQLTAARCSRPRGSVSLLFSSATGGAGTPCGDLVQPPGVFYGTHGSFAFGAVGANVARVELAFGARHRDATLLPADSGALRAGGLPPGARVYVVAVPREELVSAMTAFDAEGRIVLACLPRRCTHL